METNEKEAPMKSKRGFASMTEAMRREIAGKGGRAAHAKGTAHEFTPDEAREAGRRGGLKVSQDRAHMAQIGRVGGKVHAEHLNQSKPNASVGSLLDNPMQERIAS